MLPTSTVAAAGHPFGIPTPTSNPHPFSQSNVVVVTSLPQTAMNLMSATSFPSVTMTTNSIQNALFTPAMVPSQQPPVVFSGSGGNFFFAQPGSVGGTPVMLAPGQPNTPGAFVMTQPPTNSGTSIPAPTSANCIIRLPDGRLMMSTQAPPPMGLHSAHMSRIPGAQPAYFPISIPPGSSSTSCAPALPQQQSQQPMGMIATNPTQAFYIQVPSAPAGFGSALVATSCSTAASPMPPQPKAVQSVPCVGSLPVTNRHPILHSSSAASTPQIPTVMSPKISAPSNLNVTAALGRTPGLLMSSAPVSLSHIMDAHVTQGQSKAGAFGVGVTQVNSMQPISTAFPGGMAVARLPNGTYTTVSYARPQSPLVSMACAPPSGNETPFTLSNACAGTTRKVTNSTSRTSSKQSTSSTSTVSVMQRLDEQIGVLQTIANPTEAQAVQLKQMIQVRQQLSRSSKHEITDSSNTFPLKPASNSPTLVITSFRRREILDLLASNNLLPRVTPPSTAETFVVEFRLNQQRYQLRLTRQQKVDMERVLFSVTQQRQAEILTVLQQEQARLNSMRPRAPLPTASSNNVAGSVSSTVNFGLNVSTQQIRLQTHLQPFNSVPSIPMHPATAFGSSPGIRLVATRPMLSAPSLSNTIVCGGPVTVGSTAPVMGVVAAMAVPQIGAQGPNASMYSQNVGAPISTVNTAISHGIPSVSGQCSVTSGLFLPQSNPAGTQTFVMQQPVVVSSNSMGTAVLPGNCALSTQPHPPSSEVASTLVTSSFPGAVQQVRSVTGSLKQTSRLSRMRAYLLNDLKWSVEKPSLPCPASSSVNDEVSPPTPTQLLEALASYHLYQDADNTKEAMLKVDRILEDATNLLRDRKRRIIEAVHAEFYRETMHQQESWLEDRLLCANMALDLEREVFESEKKVFLELKHVDHMPNSLENNVKTSHEQPVEDASASTITDANSLDGLSMYVKATLKNRRRKLPEVPILKYPVSLLPPPWSDRLGPLAYLRPLTFDPDGNAKFASIHLPLWPQHPSPSDLSHLDVASTSVCETSTLTTSNPTVIKADQVDLVHVQSNSVVINYVADGGSSSDDAEADLLLGLDTRQSRVKNNEHLVNTNGLLKGAAAGSIEDRRGHDGAAAFDEQYDLWQELLQDDSMDMDEMRSESLDVNLEDECESMLPEDSSKKSLRVLENGPGGLSSDIQHSEDPDIDAAVRSILSSFN
ncbi:hypothetical protein P879_01360 [Paragonimus westermani]|uniref:Uncharacterized protein n=1 Tax=Paragonimus westermani TaxID=34504 RepID=A0A8T0DX92_9TREM|nr:hypothetical protein P879_01360 [Paragonimus westermani]